MARGVQLEFVANLIGEALTGSGGVRLFGGYSLCVTGALLMAGMGISVVLIQLLTMWSSDVVLRYVAQAPLQGGVEAARDCQVGGVCRTRGSFTISSTRSQSSRSLKMSR